MESNHWIISLSVWHPSSDRFKVLYHIMLDLHHARMLCFTVSMLDLISFWRFTFRSSLIMTHDNCASTAESQMVGVFSYYQVTFMTLLAWTWKLMKSITMEWSMSSTRWTMGWWRWALRRTCNQGEESGGQDLVVIPFTSQTMGCVAEAVESNPWRTNHHSQKKMMRTWEQHNCTPFQKHTQKIVWSD